MIIKGRPIELNKVCTCTIGLYGSVTFNKGCRGVLASMISDNRAMIAFKATNHNDNKKSVGIIFVCVGISDYEFMFENKELVEIYELNSPETELPDLTRSIKIESN